MVGRGGIQDLGAIQSINISTLIKATEVVTQTYI